MVLYLELRQKQRIMKILFTFISIAILLSCKTSKEITDTSIPKDPELMATIGEFPKTSDPIKIDSVQIKGNKMIVSVSYTGGCGNHIFNLIGSSQIAKSMPPIRTVKLFHTSENDNCKKMITRNLHFDISELAYKKEAGSEIYLAVEGVNEKIKYTFE